MKQEDQHGILMRGLGRWLVYSRPRAWVGQRFELPNLLKGVDVPLYARCLDLATGLGWATAGIAGIAPSARIVSVDYDIDVLPRAREYLKSRPAGPNAVFCRADGKRLPFHDHSFDLVVCLYGLHHFRGYFDALREIGRVLKPTGAFGLIEPIRGADKPPRGHHGTEVLTQAELWRMLDEAGFEILSSRISFGAMRAVMRSREARD
jgi:SAM-dependent methyltransferase